MTPIEGGSVHLNKNKNKRQISTHKNVNSTVEKKNLNSNVKNNWIAASLISLMSAMYKKI